MARQLGHDVNIAAVEDRLIAHFADVFGPRITSTDYIHRLHGLHRLDPGS
jgi:hypothetical protein